MALLEEPSPRTASAVAMLDAEVDVDIGSSVVTADLSTATHSPTDVSSTAIKIIT